MLSPMKKASVMPLHSTMKTPTMRQIWLALWLLLLLLLLCNNSTTCHALRVQDNDDLSFVLTELYLTCHGTEWFRNDHWLDDDTNICTWYGITCNDNGTAIVELELRKNNLNCRSTTPSVGFPMELIFMDPVLSSSLHVLDISGNYNVTVDLRFTTNNNNNNAMNTNRNTNTNNLQGLFLSDTTLVSLEGIQSFGQLQSLGVADTSLTGTFPVSLLTPLTNLISLDMSHNFLSGTIPSTLDVIVPNIRDLILSHNFFTGTIPSTIGTLQSLSLCLFQYNDLSGTLPTSMTQISTLTFLSLSHQKNLTGPLLDFSMNPILLSLDVGFNALTGSIPSTLLQSVDPKYSDLLWVDIRHNDLSGMIPSSLIRFTGLRLYASDNRITFVSSTLCYEAYEWLAGDVGSFGCQGILCPPGTYNQFGRQASSNIPCIPCPTNQLSIYYGATSCHDGDNNNGDNTLIMTSPARITTSLPPSPMIMTTLPPSPMIMTTLPPSPMIMTTLPPSSSSSSSSSPMTTTLPPSPLFVQESYKNRVGLNPTETMVVVMTSHADASLSSLSSSSSSSSSSVVSTTTASASTTTNQFEFFNHLSDVLNKNKQHRRRVGVVINNNDDHHYDVASNNDIDHDDDIVGRQGPKRRQLQSSSPSLLFLRGAKEIKEA